MRNSFQAYEICKKIESGAFVPASRSRDLNAAAYFMETLLVTARAKQLRTGWHLKLFLAIHLLGRLKKLCRGTSSYRGTCKYKYMALRRFIERRYIKQKYPKQRHLKNCYLE
jgi:hypothetical protein